MAVPVAAVAADAALVGICDRIFTRLNSSESLGAKVVASSFVRDLTQMSSLMRLASPRSLLVIDEFGGTDGLLTIEDLVEEIVGEIEAEHDVAEAPTIARRADGTIDVNGRTPVEMLEQEIGNVLSEDERNEVDTVGGLIFSLLGRIPERGEVVRHPSGVEFEVLDVDPRRIRRLRVRPSTAAARTTG